jgi:hypothetical protein
MSLSNVFNTWRTATYYRGGTYPKILVLWLTNSQLNKENKWVLFASQRKAETLKSLERCSIGGMIWWSVVIPFFCFFIWFVK